MSLADKAKLLLIPSGYKAGKVYSVFPTDGDGDFTFSRTGEATRINPGGLIETVDSNVPRIDHSGGGCPSLLLEPQRTNLITYSEDFNNAYWTKRGSTSFTQNLISPTGNVNASTITLGLRTSNDFYKVGISSVDGETYSPSFYIKNINSLTNTLKIINGQTGDSTGAYEVDMSLLSSSKWEKIDKSHPSVTVVADFVSNGASMGLQFFIDGVGASDLFDFGIFAIQLEKGSYATSYIPTNGATATRINDACLNGGDSDLFDITEGSWFLDIVPFKNSSAQREIYIHDGTNNNRLVIQFQSNNTQVRFLVASGGSIGVSLFEPITINTRCKILVTFKENDFKIYINGTLEGTDTSGNVPIGLDTFNFANVTEDFNFEGKVYDTRVYDIVLTEAEAIELTTL